MTVVDWHYMCKKDGENVDHLSLHCDYARELSFLMSCLFGVQQVMPHRVVDLLACWIGKFAKHQSGDLWKAIPLCLMWAIWRECNNRAFEGAKRPKMDLKMIIV